MGKGTRLPRRVVGTETSAVLQPHLNLFVPHTCPQSFRTQMHRQLSPLFQYPYRQPQRAFFPNENPLYPTLGSPGLGLVPRTWMLEGKESSCDPGLRSDEYVGCVTVV